MATEDWSVLSQYFMENDNIPKKVRQSFVRVKKEMENVKSDDHKMNEEGLQTSSQVAKNESCLLGRDVLINNKWLFYNDNGYLGEMTFGDNGVIKGYTSRNERTWKLSQHAYGHTLLEFYGDGNKKTCTFISSITDGCGKWRLQGPFHQIKGWKHYLRQV